MYSPLRALVHGRNLRENRTRSTAKYLMAVVANRNTALTHINATSRLVSDSENQVGRRIN